MGDENVDPALVDWSKTLRCNASELAKPGRKLVMETLNVDLLIGGKRKPVQVLICNDAVVLSVVKKKSTFSRKRAELSYISFDDMECETDPAELKLTLNDEHELICCNKDVFDKVSALLESSRPSPLSSSSGTGGSGSGSGIDGSGSTSRPSSPDETDDLQRQQTGSSPPGTDDEEGKSGGEDQSMKEKKSTMDMLMMNGVKVSAVFDRMEMWIGAGRGEDGTRQMQCIKTFREVLDTERTYCQDLLKFVTEYITPLREARIGDRPLISQEDMNLIFNNVESILKANTELLKSLQSGVSRISRNGEIPSISEVAGVFAKEFVRVMPFFKMYSVYCHQYNAALERLQILRETNKDLHNFLQRREARKKNAQASVQSLIIKPIQRICKYPLLFRELLNHMSKIEGDADFQQHFAELSNAEKQVQAIASSVNTKVSEAENQDQVMKVYLELGGESGCPGLVTPSRRHVRTEDVMMREVPMESRRQQYRVYLFNDLIIFAKVASGTLGKGKKLSTIGRIGNLTLKKNNAKVVHSFELDQCKRIKTLNVVDEENRAAFEIHRVSRVEKNGAKATQIQRFEVWCDNKAEAETLMNDIKVALNVLEEQMEAREEAIPKGKARAWASRTRSRNSWRNSLSSTNGSFQNLEDGSSSSSLGMVAVSTGLDGDPNNKDDDETNEKDLPTTPSSVTSATGSVVCDDDHNTTDKQQQQKSGENNTNQNNLSPQPMSRNKTVPAAATTTPQTPSTDFIYHSNSLGRKSVDRGQLSLDDLRNKYSAAPRMLPDPKQGGRLEFEIEFPPGPLGLALENSREPKGVLVACVAALSVAERGGLALGDRVVAVGGNSVPEGATWDQVVDIIKSLPRPLKIQFERTSETMAAAKAKSGKAQKFQGSKSKRGSGASNTSLGSVVAGMEEDDPNGSGMMTSPTSASSNGSGIDGNVGKQRQWASRLDRRKASLGTSRLLSLEELEQYYSNSAGALADDDKMEPIFNRLITLAESKPQEDQAKIKKCISILQEIIQTERGYVCDLRKLVGEYMIPLRQAKSGSATGSNGGNSNNNGNSLIAPEDVESIFLNAEAILKTNSEFLKSLHSNIAGTTELADLIQVVTKELVRILPFLKIYSTYCHRYGGALARLVACRQSNAGVDEFLTQRENRPENKHSSLQSLLIKPVQRICKYPLLISTLRDATAKLGSDNIDPSIHVELQRASDAVTRIAAEVNEKVSEAESMDQVIKIYEELGGELPTLVEPHRRFICQEEVAVLKAPFHEGKSMPQTMFIFNDLVVLAKFKKEGSFKFLDSIDLRKSDVKKVGEFMFQITQVTRKSDSKGGSTSHVTTCIDKFRVTTESHVVCNKLVQAISTEMQKLLEIDTNKRASSGKQKKEPIALGSKRHSSIGSSSSTLSGGRNWKTKRASTKISLEEMETRYVNNK